MNATLPNNIILPRGIVSGEKGRDAFLAMLVSANIISQGKKDELATRVQSAEQIVADLIDKEKQDEETIIKIYARYARAPFADLKKIDPDVVDAIPYRMAAKYLILPYGLSRKVLRLAVARPDRLENVMSIIGEIAKKTGVRVEIGFTTKSAINSVLSRLDQDRFNYNKNTAGEDIPDVDLSAVKIPKDIIELLPQETAQKYKIVVFERKDDGTLKIGMVNPGDAQTKEVVDYISRENNVTFEKYKISDADFMQAIKSYNITAEEGKNATGLLSSLNKKTSINNNQSSTNQDFPDSDSVTLPDKEARRSSLAAAYSSGDTNLDMSLPDGVKDKSDIEKYIESGNVPMLVAAIMKLASNMHASDIHIEAQKSKVLVRYRVDGQLHDIIDIPNTLQKAIVARVKILAKLKIDETRIPQDGRFDLVVSKHEVDVRVSIMPTVFGEKVVLRLLDKNAGLFKIESLGITGDNYTRFVRAIEKPYGVLMVTGPTGAGKSTTLYAAINHLKKNTINIVTLEDPIEYEIQGINQIQVKPNIGFTFAEGLGAVLRQDPNIIMVGEIRDAETANLVTHASLTGHLVLTTLHTNDASGAMPRLVNMGVEPFLISSSMNAIVGQRLVRRICPKCRVEAQVPQSVSVQVQKELAEAGISTPVKFYQGKGCPSCGGSGYSGRTGIYEVIEVDSGMEQLIISRAPASKIKEYAVSRGMYPIRIDGFQKVIKGITTVDEVMRATAIN